MCSAPAPILVLAGSPDRRLDVLMFCGNIMELLAERIFNFLPTPSLAMHTVFAHQLTNFCGFLLNNYLLFNVILKNMNTRTETNGPISFFPILYTVTCLHLRITLVLIVIALNWEPMLRGFFCTKSLFRHYFGIVFPFLRYGLHSFPRWITLYLAGLKNIVFEWAQFRLCGMAVVLIIIYHLCVIRTFYWQWFYIYFQTTDENVT